jgi:hypothetical protein
MHRLSVAELAGALDVTPILAERMIRTGTAEANIRRGGRRTGPTDSAGAAPKVGGAGPSGLPDLGESLAVVPGAAGVPGAMSPADIAGLLAIPDSEVASLIWTGALTGVADSDGQVVILPEHSSSTSLSATRKPAGTWG